MSSVDYRVERRADEAARAEQRRLDAAAADARRADRARAADERAASLREQKRVERAGRRARRAGRRGRALAPRSVYRTGTLALVVSSGLASLPAQVLHFVDLSPMLLPLPFALEGAAWVMAAGVAYADDRGLSASVRWLLRSFVVAAAGFAASINYTYGHGLPHLSASNATVAGVGLAAVTLLGPLLFEIRQWVSTLAADAVGPDAREQRRHDRTRRRHHRKVAKIADRLLSAAPFGTLPTEDAWAQAWTIHTGVDSPGMTPDLHRQAVASAAELAKARTLHPGTENDRKTTAVDTDRSTSDLEQSTPAAVGDAGPVTSALVLPAPLPVDFGKTAPFKAVRAVNRPTDSRPAPAAVKVAAVQSTRPRRATGRVPAVARTPRPTRTAAELLDQARTATADWSDAELTAEGIRKAVHTSADKARGLRGTLRAERAAGTGEAVA